MSLIVQKYGGTSVASLGRMQRIAERVRARQAEGHQIALVVSAMGHTTDELLEMARTLHSSPRQREVDLLLSTGEVVSCALMAVALMAAGIPARALTGAQAGIVTDGAFSRAAIASLAPERVQAVLDAGEVPVVAGFQGVDDITGVEITTLGRGGSDTTAVALAIALGAEWCEIYTDVDGIFTADPRIVPGARQLSRIGPAEMLELAQQGAQVMHPRAVELGGAYGTPVLVRSSFRDRPGTWIIPPERAIPGRNLEEERVELRNKVSGIAHDTNVAKLTVLGLPCPEFALFRLFGPLAEAGINVDAIAHTAQPGGERADCAFTVAEVDLPEAIAIAEATATELGALKVYHERAVGKVSVIGLGVQDTPGLAACAFLALGRAGIPVDMVTTSQIRITCLVPEDRVPEAVRLLHATLLPPPESHEGQGTRTQVLPGQTIRRELPAYS